MNPTPQHILVIDDDDSHRLLVRRALRDTTAMIVEAASLDDAQSALLNHANNLHLVILDMNLRGRPGLEILSSIRAAFPLDRLPVILLSTSALELDVQRAYQAGANCYIIKDTDPREFNRTVSRAALYFLRTLSTPRS